MPKIIRNEIEYSSTTSTANQINYLNTVSGLSATNVQDAIDEIKQNTILHTQFKGTTDSTGDLLITDLPLASYQIISAYKNRAISGESAIGYCILGGNNQTAPYVHIINSNNQNLASTAVTLEIYYIAI